MPWRLFGNVNLSGKAHLNTYVSVKVDLFTQQKAADIITATRHRPPETRSHYLICSSVITSFPLLFFKKYDWTLTLLSALQMKRHH